MLFTGAVIDVIFYEYIKITIIYSFECKQRYLNILFFHIFCVAFFFKQKTVMRVRRARPVGVVKKLCMHVLSTFFPNHSEKTIMAKKK